MEALELLETVDDDLDRLAVTMVKISDPEAAKQVAEEEGEALSITGAELFGNI